MTPAARIAAAIDLLDLIIDGAPAAQSLTRWARANRYAGSKDRTAVRDHVFTALRRLHSYAALGGATNGRGVMIGALRAQGIDPDDFFTGEGYGADALSAAERDFKPDEPDTLTALDCPEWLAPQLRSSLGVDFEPVMQALQRRAPVFLRVNNALTDIDQAIAALANDDITAQPHALSATALEVTKNPRRVQNSRAYLEGLVEVQDAGSQAIVDRISPPKDARILDFCAGGGGKSLALAGRGAKNIFAHDLSAPRMKDLPKRADRAGVQVEILDSDAVKSAAPFDLILADVPCSGSGAWRRNPAEKWQFTSEKLHELRDVQAGILNEIVDYVSESGVIAYITCSMLDAENNDQISVFLDRHPKWSLRDTMRLTPMDGGDGFYLALLSR